MEPTRSSGGGSGKSGTYSPETVESLRFEEEIQSLMLHPTFDPSPVSSGGGGGRNSFTALLGLPPTQAVELLHEPPPPPPPAIHAGFRLRGDPHLETFPLPLGCSPTFPSNAALIDRAARFSVFAAEEALEASNSGDVKPEPTDSGDRAPPAEKNLKVTGNKRKEAEKSKVKGTAKKSKSAEENTGDGEKLPYVHVRARRGQATDSHSLAERARREKINARMKLLQELVPGCNKISGTALVLDEIINHVQSLQRQVEFLSMRLAAVNPRIDFNGLDNILSTECGRLTSAGNGMGVAMQQSMAWLDGMINKQQQFWHVDPQQQQQQQQELWERDGVQDSHIFVSSPATPSIFSYDSSNPNSVSLSNQLKTELESLPNQLKTEL